MAKTICLAKSCSGRNNVGNIKLVFTEPCQESQSEKIEAKFFRNKLKKRLFKYLLKQLSLDFKLAASNMIQKVNKGKYIRYSFFHL